MNLGKIKTFLILLFLGINIFLVISLFMSSEFRINDNTISNTISILNKSQISIDKGVIPKKAENLKNIEAKNIIYTKQFQKSETSKKFRISGDSFTCKESVPELYSQSGKKIHMRIRSFLEEAGFDSGYMKFSSITKDKNKKTFKIKCTVKGYDVFDSKMNVTVNKDGFTICGMWYEPQTTSIKSNSKVRKSVYITSILVDITNNEDFIKNSPMTIKKIDCGYMSGSLYGNQGHVTATALPYYRITDDKGNKYYYNALDGSYNAAAYEGQR